NEYYFFGDDAGRDCISTGSVFAQADHLAIGSIVFGIRDEYFAGDLIDRNAIGGSDCGTVRNEIVFFQGFGIHIKDLDFSIKHRDISPVPTDYKGTAGERYF